MRWQGLRRSGNVQDRRGVGGGGAMAGGGLGVVALVLVGWFLGVDVTPFLEQGAAPPAGPARELTPEERQTGEFVARVLGGTEDVWTGAFRDQLDARYQPTGLVLYSGATGTSGCGGADAAVGPFYCPADRKVYLDTDFFALMQRQLGAGGDFAFAYVVAHEVGHHVENQLGILDWAAQARQGAPAAEANAVSVRVELMADCLAGIFARGVQDQRLLDAGDIDEAMTAARQIGDDTLQRNAGRRPVPDSFTHGTSAQRQEWFRRGFDSGRIRDCDTRTVRRL